jgi:hypothetical protein
MHFGIWITKCIHGIMSWCEYFKSNPNVANILNTLSSFKPAIVFHCEFGIPSKCPSSHKDIQLGWSEVLEVMVCITNVERKN